MEETKVAIPVCRFEELIDIETRCHILISKLDNGEEVQKEDIYLLFGYEKTYKAIKEKKEKELNEFLEKGMYKCQNVGLVTKNTEAEMELVVQT